MMKSVVKQKKYLQPKEITMCYIIFGMKSARWYRGDQEYWVKKFCSRVLRLSELPRCRERLQAAICCSEWLESLKCLATGLDASLSLSYTISAFFEYLNKFKCIIDIMTAFQKGVNLQHFIWAWSKEIDTLFFVHEEKKNIKSSPLLLLDLQLFPNWHFHITWETK